MVSILKPSQQGPETSLRSVSEHFHLGVTREVSRLNSVAIPLDVNVLRVTK